jgi:hypothetical protein
MHFILICRQWCKHSSDPDILRRAGPHVHGIPEPQQQCIAKEMHQVPVGLGANRVTLSAGPQPIWLIIVPH